MEAKFKLRGRVVFKCHVAGWLDQPPGPHDALEELNFRRKFGGSDELLVDELIFDGVRFKILFDQPSGFFHFPGDPPIPPPPVQPSRREIEKKACMSRVRKPKIPDERTRIEMMLATLPGSPTPEDILQRLYRRSKLK